MMGLAPESLRNCTYWFMPTGYGFQTSQASLPDSPCGQLVFFLSSHSDDFYSEKDEFRPLYLDNAATTPLVSLWVWLSR